MSYSPMEVDENEETPIYSRTVEDVCAIIKHAKLDVRSLTSTTQALYYPSASVAAGNLRLLELDDHILSQIREGRDLHFKGGLNEKVVLCTDEKTYDVKAAEISNSLLMVPSLKFAAATSTSPLRSPRSGGNNSFERSLNDSAEEAELNAARTLEKRQVLAVFHEYFECREIHPRFRKLLDLLALTPYAGPEHEDQIDRKLLFTRAQLLDTVQCSRRQFDEGLRQCRGFEVEGFVRVLEEDYEYRIVTLMVGLIDENSWLLDEIERDETLMALDGIAPREIVAGLFELYTEETVGKAGKWTYREDLVARIVAQNILHPGLKFRFEEFMGTWAEAMPDGMKVNRKYLRGLGICDKEGNTSCIRALNECHLPTTIPERMKVLFKTKTKWTLDEMEPYIECFTTPSLSVSSFLAKYARSLTENGTRFYVAKH